MKATKPRLKLAQPMASKPASKVPDLRTAYTQMHGTLVQKIRHAQEQIQIHDNNIRVWGAEALKIQGKLEALNEIEPEAETPAEPTETPAVTE